VALTEMAPHGVASAAGVATVNGRGRAASDVVGELLEVLADEPGVVECDLTATVAEGSAVAADFAPVGDYLAHWPGSVVMVNAPDDDVRESLDTAEFADRLLIHAGGDAGAVEAHRMLPPLRRTGMALSSVPTAPHEARTFAAHTLQDWWLPQVIDAASQVVSAFVTDAVVHAPSALDLTLSRVDQRIRIAVRDHYGAPAGPGAEGGTGLSGRDRQLVHAFADGWGVVPASTGGKTVWAVLDAARLGPER
jgi:hypothetical protein